MAYYYSRFSYFFQCGDGLTVYHFRGHDSLSLAVFNGIVLWGATDQTGTGNHVPLAFESDIRSGLWPGATLPDVFLL
jgi:hypothetical protein